jgi:thiol:disulfide interchange protein DsbA
MKLLKQLWKAALVAGFVAVSGAAVAAEPFKLLNPAQPVETKGKVEVIEFYWYGCPHCYHLEPKLSAWLAKLPKDVAFRRIPAVWNPRMEAHAKLFHALESLGLS